MRPWIIALTVVAVGLVARVVVGGYSSLQRADEAAAAGQIRVAALEYRHALSWYLPIAPWRETASQRLLALSDAALSDKNWEQAVMLLNMHRSGILSGRSVLGEESEFRRRGDAKLAEAMGEMEVASEEDIAAARQSATKTGARRNEGEDAPEPEENTTPVATPPGRSSRSPATAPPPTARDKSHGRRGFGVC